MKQPITVVIACHDSTQALSACVRHCAAMADQVLIAELDGQADAWAIAQSHEHVRVIAPEAVRSDDFLNWAISQATHQWVLLLDSDERLPPELADEIELALSRGATHDAYSIDRETFVHGKRLEASTASPSRRVRLFQKNEALLVQTGTEKQVEVTSGRIGKLATKIARHPDWRFERALSDLTDLASEEAAAWQQQGKQSSSLRLLLSPAWQFGIQYFWRGSIFDGRAGVRVAWQAAMKTFCTHAHLIDLDTAPEHSIDIAAQSDETVDLLDPTFRRAA